MIRVNDMSINQIENDKNPTKDFVYLISRMLYFFGLGDCWFEGNAISWNRKKMYRIWCFFGHGFISAVILAEIAGNFQPNLTQKERSDVMQFSWAHPTIYIKCLFVSLQRHRIRDLLKNLLVDTRSIFTCKSLERAAIKNSKLYSFAIISTCYFTFLSIIIDGIVVAYKEGKINVKIIMYFLFNS